MADQGSDQGGAGTGGEGMRALVLDVARRRAFVLADGRFLRVRAVPGWEVGQEIALPPAAVPSLATPARRRVVLAAAAGCAALVGGAGAMAGLAAAKPVAMVSVDMGSGVELGVNAAGRVVSASATDPSGAQLLALGGLRGEPLSAAVGVVVARAAAAGYLSVPGQPASASSTSSGPAATSSSGSSATGPTSSGTPSGGARGRAPGTGTKAGGGASDGHPAARSASGSSGPPPAAPSGPPANLGAILLTVAPTGRSRGPGLPASVVANLSAAERDAQDVLAQHNPQAAVSVAQAQAGTASQAAADKLGVGQYLLWQAVQAAGVPLPVSAVRGRPIAQVLLQAGVPRRDDAAVIDAMGTGRTSLVAAVIGAARSGAAPDALEALVHGGGQAPGGKAPHAGHSASHEGPGSGAVQGEAPTGGGTDGQQTRRGGGATDPGSQGAGAGAQGDGGAAPRPPAAAPGGSAASQPGAGATPTPAHGSGANGPAGAPQGQGGGTGADGPPAPSVSSAGGGDLAARQGTGGGTRQGGQRSRDGAAGPGQQARGGDGAGRDRGRNPGPGGGTPAVPGGGSGAGGSSGPGGGYGGWLAQLEQWFGGGQPGDGPGGGGPRGGG